jgi:hypothetical protein
MLSTLRALKGNADVFAGLAIRLIVALAVFFTPRLAS